MLNQQLTECDKEPIHLLSTINSQKFLLTIEKNNYKILQISSNYEAFFKNLDKPIDTCIIQELFDNTFMADFKDAITRLYNQKNNIETFVFGGCFFIVQMQNDYYIIEFEVFDKTVQNVAITRSYILRGLTQAYENKEFFMLYQKQFKSKNFFAVL